MTSHVAEKLATLGSDASQAAHEDHCLLHGRKMVCYILPRRRKVNIAKVPIRLITDITKSWLSDMLDQHIDDLVEIKPIGTGQMSSTTRIRYIREGQSYSLICKYASVYEETRSLGLSLKHYFREAVFYRKFGQTLQAGLPKCHAAIVDEEGWFTLLLEDLGAGQVGDQIVGTSVENARKALSCLAKLQAPVLNDSSLMTDSWLNIESSLTQDLFAQSLPIFLQRYKVKPEHLVVLEFLAKHLTAWESDRRPPFAIFHGDYRLDNIIFMPDRAVGLDWGGLSWSSAMRDAGYFLGNSLLVEDRRKHEKELFKGYIDELVQLSSAHLDLSQAWEEYRRQTFYGLTQHIIAAAVLPQTERGDRMFNCLVDRQSQHVVDLDAMSLVLKTAQTNWVAF